LFLVLSFYVKNMVITKSLRLWFYMWILSILRFSCYSVCIIHVYRSLHSFLQLRFSQSPSSHFWVNIPF